MNNRINESSEYSDADLEKIWQKGKEICGADPNLWRNDEFDLPMCRDEYGNRNSEFGWEVDHILPVSMGGSDELTNLRPLNWYSNASRSNNVR